MFETLVAATIFTVTVATASALSSSQSTKRLNHSTSKQSSLIRVQRLSENMKRSEKLTKEIKDRF